MPTEQPDNRTWFENYLDCPCQYFAPMADDDPLMAAYGAARERGAREGFVPMLVVLSDTLAEALSEGGDGNQDPEAIRAERRRLLSLPLRENPAAERMRERWGVNGGCPWNEIGAPAGGEVLDRFVGYWDYGTKKTVPLLLAEIPVKHPWEVFAWLPFGGWNECPDTVGQMEMAKYWFTRHGAVPAVITSDVLEYILPAPAAKEEAARLALEQYAFCADIVDQGVGSLEALADGLARSDHWYFWWD